MKTLIALFALCWSAVAAIPPANTYDFEAKAWRDTVRTNSSDVSSSSYRIATKFMLNIKWWGVRQCVAYSLPYLGTNLAAAKMPLIHDVAGSSGAITATSIAEGDYSEATGITGSGSGYLVCGFGMNVIGTFAHMSAYVRSVPTANNHILIGANSSPNGNCFIYYNPANTSIYGDMCDASADCITSDVNGIGLYTHTRTATNNASMYKNGALFCNTTANLGVAPGTVVVTIHAWNNLGSVILQTTRPISYAEVGYAMNAAQGLNQYLAVQRMQLDLNRAK